MKYLMAGIRLIVFFIYAVILAVSLFILYYVTRLFGKKFSVRLIHNLMPAFAFPLRLLMGIRLKTFGRENIPRKQAFLMATNHIGYVELFAIFKIRPMAFVAKEDILSWPLIGPVVKAAGTVFVDRTTGGLSEQYIAEVSEAMKNHINFWFAPEKTTSDGTWLRPFSSALFVVANRWKCPLVPAVFVIKELNGKPLSPQRRLEVAWANDAQGNSTPFVKHFLHFFTLRSILLEMHILPPVVPHYNDEDIRERRAFSGEVYERMADALEKFEADFDRNRRK